MVTYTDTVAVPEVGNATDVDVVLDVNMTEPSFEKSVTTLAVSEPILIDQSQGLKCNVPMFSENAVSMQIAHMVHNTKMPNADDSVQLAKSVSSTEASSKETILSVELVVPP